MIMNSTQKATRRELIERIEELEKENQKLWEAYNIENEMKSQYIDMYQDIVLKENCVSKDKIKTEIEEMLSYSNNFNCGDIQELEDKLLRGVEMEERMNRAIKYLEKERENHYKNVKLCSTNMEHLLLSSALCTCDHALKILKGKE